MTALSVPAQTACSPERYTENESCDLNADTFTVHVGETVETSFTIRPKLVPHLASETAAAKSSLETSQG